MKRFLQSAFTTVTDWTNNAGAATGGARTAARPTSASRAQLFDQLWGSLQNFDAIKEEMDSESSVTALFNKIIQTLLEEEREISEERTGECIERFLKGRCLEQMYKMATANKPQGMFKWVVHAISRIFQHMKTPLLAHMSIHKPVVKLIEEWNPEIMSFEEKLECLQLINSLILKLKEDPLFIRLFFRDENEPSSPRHDSAAPGYEQGRDFVLFKALERLYTDGGESRLLEQMRRSLLSCLAIDDHSDDYMAVYYSDQQAFMVMLVEELVEYYFSAIQTMTQSAIQEYLKHVAFCNSLTKLDRRAQFSQNFVKLIHDKFMLQVFAAGLVNDSLQEANLHTILACETLQHVDSPCLLEEFIGLLLEDRRVPHPEDKGPVIKEVLLERIRFKAIAAGADLAAKSERDASTVTEQIAANTLRLFSTLFGLSSQLAAVSTRLLFSEYPPSFVAPQITSASLSDFAAKCIGFPELITLDNEAVDNDIDEVPQVANSSITDYKLHARQDLKRRLAGQSAISSKAQVDSAERPFVGILLENLDHLFELNLDSALVLLEIILKLAELPIPSLHKFLLHTQALENYHSLSETIAQVKDKAAALFVADPAFVNELHKFRVTTFNNPSTECNLKTQTPSLRVLQGITLLHEFCKEIIATMEVMESLPAMN